ncbi:DEAD/DEAH box helicase [Sinomonas humi]|uniref:DEAD/DEAH box helicase n=1 Tax=Sinomonas humi TaxID=1338436 RepID=A0A0B2AQV6_9MICC|nr:DEAD/DEAH box helicase [Sinomonas humi]KHL04258.1 DEAD/DEAH box helicase [Sinomonas humi]
MPAPTFAELGVPAVLDHTLAAQGIESPFPIQTATLPDTLAGRDVLGRGRTGSGKTLAFAIPLVTRLDAAGAAVVRVARRPLGLVLAPTRELATQINATVEPLARAAGLTTTVIYGGVSQMRQERALNAGVDIVIACPGRLEDLVRQGLVDLGHVKITVLDEADHMADLGFLPVVKRLLDKTPKDAQRLLFSATLDNGVDALVKRYLHNPLTHSLDEARAAVTTMEHHVFVAADAGAKKNLVHALASGRGRRVLFMRTKHHAKRLAKQLTQAGIPAVDLHGNLSQNARDRNLADFSSGAVRVLVATDVAARGVHVDDVELVVHVDPPAEHKSYLHRSGRTARAGSEGAVVTVALPEQQQEVRQLLRHAGVKVEFQPVTSSSAAVTELVGEPAEYVDPAEREAAVAAKQPRQGGGTSTGANAQRKRSRRGRGGSGAGTSEGRSASPQRTTARRATTPGKAAEQGSAQRTTTRAAQGKPAGHGSASKKASPASKASTAHQAPTRSAGQGAAPTSTPARRGPRRAGAPASNTRRG